MGSVSRQTRNWTESVSNVETNPVQKPIWDDYRPEARGR